MPSQASGQAPKPSKGVSRPVRKPKAVGVGEHLAAMGGTAAHSAGHAAHDAIHGAKKGVRRVGKAIASIDLNPF